MASGLSTVVLFITVVYFLPKTESILCYQCGTTSETDDCIVNTEAMANASRWELKQDEILADIKGERQKEDKEKEMKELTDKFVKNCSDSNDVWDRCYIEYHHVGGKVAYYTRGCHDGETFTEKTFSVRFANHTPNNHTTCARPKQAEMVCFQFCQEDFCNGPVAAEVEKEVKCTKYNSSIHADFSDMDLKANYICGASSGDVHLTCMLILLCLTVIVLVHHYLDLFPPRGTVV